MEFQKTNFNEDGTTACTPSFLNNFQDFCLNNNNKIIDLSNNIGDLSNLNTINKDNLVKSINEIKNVVNENGNNIGSLSNLNTENKDNLVNAINENIVNYQINKEIMTNKFYNGKRVYLKIYNGQMINTSSGSQSLFVIDVNFDDVWIDYGFSKLEKSDEQLPVNWFYTSTDYMRTWLRKADKNVRVKTGANLSAYDYFIIIYYTKN